MSSPDTPPVPDYKGAAEETAKGSERTAVQQTYANRPVVNTPWGRQTWNTSTATDPATGAPVTAWQQNIELSPQQQAALDAQTAISTARSQAAADMLPQVMRNFGVGYGGSGYGLGFGTGGSSTGGNRVDFAASPRPAPAAPAWQTQGNESSYGNRLPPPVFEAGTRPGSPVAPVTPGQGPVFGGSVSGGPVSGGPVSGGVSVDPNYWRSAAQGAALGFQQPLQIQKQQQLETQLSNMGIPRGSEAWTSEMRNLQDQNARDNLQAFGAGQSEANMLFNQALQANNQGLATAGLGLQQQNQAFGQNLAAQGFNQTLRQQQIAEMLAARTQPLNELNALLNGQQVGMPQMPGAPQAGRAQGVDYSGALQGTYGAQLQNANAQNAASASTTNALMNAGTMAAFMFSDIRLKQDIEKVGELPNGIGVYKYRFANSTKWELGVLAQEVLETMPDAVKQNENGYLMVDYDKVLSDE